LADSTERGYGEA